MLNDVIVYIPVKNFGIGDGIFISLAVRALLIGKLARGYIQFKFRNIIFVKLFDNSRILNGIHCLIYPNHRPNADDYQNGYQDKKQYVADIFIQDIISLIRGLRVIFRKLTVSARRGTEDCGIFHHSQVRSRRQIHQARSCRHNRRKCQPRGATAYPKMCIS